MAKADLGHIADRLQQCALLLLSGSSWHSYCRCTNNLLTVCDQFTVLGLGKSLIGTVTARTPIYAQKHITIVRSDLKLHQTLNLQQCSAARYSCMAALHVSCTSRGCSSFAISARGLYRRHRVQPVESRSTSWNPADEYSCAHKKRSALQLVRHHPPQTGSSLRCS